MRTVKATLPPGAGDVKFFPHADLTDDGGRVARANFTVDAAAPLAGIERSSGARRPPERRGAGHVNESAGGTDDGRDTLIRKVGFQKKSREREKGKGKRGGRSDSSPIFRKIEDLRTLLEKHDVDQLGCQLGTPPKTPKRRRGIGMLPSAFPIDDLPAYVGKL